MSSFSGKYNTVSIIMGKVYSGGKNNTKKKLKAKRKK